MNSQPGVNSNPQSQPPAPNQNIDHPKNSDKLDNSNPHTQKLDNTDQNIEQQIDETLIKLENEVARDVAKRITQHSSGRSPKSSHAEAKAKLLALVSEAQLSILRGFRRRDFVRDDFYEHAVIKRIAELQTHPRPMAMNRAD